MPPSAAPTILVIEDDPVLRTDVQAALVAADLEVITASNPVEALSELQGRLPDVVILDITRFHLDGLAFLDRVRGNDRTRHVPLIIMTAAQESGAVVEALERGADDFLVTPLRLPELVARVRAKIRRPSVARNELQRGRRVGLLTEPQFRRELRNELARVDRGAEAGCLARLALVELPTIGDRLTARALDEIAFRLADLLERESSGLEQIGRGTDGSVWLLLPELVPSTAKARLYALGQSVMRTVFTAGGERLRFTPVAGLASLERALTVEEMARRVESATEIATLHLDLEPVIYDSEVEAEQHRRRAEREAGRREPRWAQLRERLRLPMQIGLNVVLGIVAPYYFYGLLAEHGYDITRAAYLLVVGALFFTALLIFVEGVLALKRIDPPPPSRPPPSASAIIAAYLPNEAATVVETIESFLRLDYPAGLQVILAYNTPKDLPIEAELQAIAERDPRFVPFRVPTSTSKAQNVNAALTLLSGEFVGLFDADHHPDRDCFMRAWQWLSNGYDVVQGRCLIRNGTESWVARMVAVEFETIYAINHPGRARLHGFGIFGGSNGYWKTELLRQTRMHGFMLTEDIDSSIRVVQQGRRIVSDPQLVSRELAPVTLKPLWHQRLRWAQGWFQVSLERLWSGLASPNLTVRQKFGMFHLLAWREIYPWVSLQMIPLVMFWIDQRRPIDWLVPLFVFTTIFSLISGPLQTIFTYLAADPEVKRHKRWFWWYLLVALLFYTEFKNLIARIAQIKEAMGERAWNVTPRVMQKSAK